MKLWPVSLYLAQALLAQTPAPWPIQYREETRTNPPLRLHVATVDLTDPRVRLRVVREADPDGPGPWQTTLETVRNLASKNGLDLAINGDYFDGKDALTFGGKRIPYLPGNWGKVMGWAMSDGTLWSSAPSEAVLAVDRQGKITITGGRALPDDAVQAISGAYLAISYGRKRLLPGGAGPREPRSGACLKRDERQLVMLAVDGRHEVSAGMTLTEFVDELARLGCYHALGFDDGGSVTLVLRKDRGRELELVNRPSDLGGLERSVANALGAVVRDQATK